MDNFYLYASVIGIGVGIVLVLMVIELTKEKKTSLSKPASKPTQNKGRSPLDILTKLGLHHKQSPQLPSQLRKDMEPQNTLNTIATPEEISRPASSTKMEPVIITQPATESEEYLDLKNKYEKLESLFQEKSNELEKKEIAFVNESKIRKDFNKVKDILEKELKDTKDKCHKITLELAAAKPEIENQKNRIDQLQEMINRKNKDIVEKEHSISELTKQLANITAKAAEPTVPPSAQPEPPAPSEMPPADLAPVQESSPPLEPQAQPQIQEPKVIAKPAEESVPATPVPETPAEPNKPQAEQPPPTADEKPA